MLVREQYARKWAPQPLLKEGGHIHVTKSLCCYCECSETCNHMHTELEVSPTELSGAYFQVDMSSIAL